jgi:hypothetical protein
VNTATVIQAGYAEHPESGKDLLRITVDHEYAVGGETNPTTWLWVDRRAPVPRDGEQVRWDGHHAWIEGHIWPKVEYDSNPAKALC